MRGFTLQELTQRYNISKSSVNARIKHLAIETELIANRIKVLESDVLRLDGLDAFLKESKAHRYTDYIEPTEVEIVNQDLAPETEQLIPSNQSNQLSLFEDYIIPIAKKIDYLIEEKIKSTPTTNSKTEILATQRTLQEAVDKEWAISSSQLKELLGRKSLPSGKVFSRHLFTFHKIGRDGSEGSWYVTKTKRITENTENEQQ
jgi:predicted DNA-binding protein YlxM (UPF0122 family)